MEFDVKSAQHVGRFHLNKFKNNQDALAVHIGQDIIAAVICDGCSEGPYSEVGAHAAKSFLLLEAVRLVKSGVPVHALGNVLYEQLKRFINDFLNLYPFSTPHDRNMFIRDNLLFTVMGVILTPEASVIFHAGDGMFIVNDEITIIDQDNRPLYPAYHAVERTALPATFNLPTSFATVQLNTADIDHLALCSDAWVSHQDLISQIWDHKRQVELQRQLNMWSRNERFFGDDASIVVIQRAHPELEEISESDTSQIQVITEADNSSASESD